MASLSAIAKSFLSVSMLAIVRVKISRRCSSSDEPLVLCVLDFLLHHQPLWLIRDLDSSGTILVPTLADISQRGDLRLAPHQG